MSKFCKIFELENNEQVLVMQTFDTENDMPQISLTTDFDGAQANMKLTFATEEKMLDAYNNYSAEQAIKFRNSTSEFFD